MILLSENSKPFLSRSHNNSISGELGGLRAGLPGMTVLNSGIFMDGNVMLLTMSITCRYC